MESSDHLTQMWRDLYVMLGTSSAALIGLLFVVTSLHLSEVIRNPVFRVRAYNGTLYLLMLLVEAELVLVPQPAHLLGAELSAINFAGLWLPLSNAYRYFYKNTDTGRRGGVMIYRPITYAVGYMLGLAGGIALIERSDWGMYLITASYTILLIAVVLGAWAIMLGIGQKEKQKKARRPLLTGISRGI
jgi:hypothetical protein